MITKEQALNLKHGDIVHLGECKLITGPRGGRHYKITKYRVASKIYTWKTRPDMWQVSVRFGMQNTTYHLTNSNAYQFHLESECPLLWPQP